MFFLIFDKNQFPDCDGLLQIFDYYPINQQFTYLFLLKLKGYSL